MIVNAEKLYKELVDAGIDNGGVSSDGEVWDIDGVTEIQDRPDVAAVIDAHDPTDTEGALIETILQDAEGNKALFDVLLGVTPSQAETWVENNVNDLATAKDILKKLAMAVTYILGKIRVVE
jgi:hypothetical protein